MNTFKKMLLFVAPLVFALSLDAIAQVPALLLSSPTGTEQINVLVPSTGTITTSPQITSVTINQIRNTTNYLLSGATSGTLSTVTCANGGTVILTAAAGTLTVNLPATCPDGQVTSIANGTSSNFSGTITVATTDSSTIGNGTTAVNLAAGNSQAWQYTSGAKVWYRIR